MREEKVVVQLHRSLKVEKALLDGEPEARELWQRAYRDFHHGSLRVRLTIDVVHLHRFAQPG